MKKIKLLSLFLVLSLAGGTIACQQGTKSNNEINTVSATDFKSLVDQQSGIILDVRTPEEFAEGHIPGAINMDVNGPNFKDEVGKLDKGKAYEVYCRSGKRSLKASEMMQSEGFTKVTNLDGGIMGWQEKGYPVEK
ncbi:MAG: rhodanese-like domain-containing protein [Bacteroidetes bacterium]|nr:rhodanese-like domain-containing protein [Bacteroidota bacterium]MBL0137284.1 rhodanese-like domain-containing protein [Bacteroidota bacterium]